MASPPQSLLNLSRPRFLPRPTPRPPPRPPPNTRSALHHHHHHHPLLRSLHTRSIRLPLRLPPCRCCAAAPAASILARLRFCLLSAASSFASSPLSPLCLLSAASSFASSPLSPRCLLSASPLPLLCASSVRVSALLLSALFLPFLFSVSVSARRLLSSSLRSTFKSKCAARNAPPLSLSFRRFVWGPLSLSLSLDPCSTCCSILAGPLCCS